MKSKIRDVRPSDSFVSDLVWKRVELDLDELIEALRREAVLSLATELLAPYQEKACFWALVHNVRDSIMDLVCSRLRDATQSRTAVVLFLENRVEWYEEVARKDRLSAPSDPPSYWVGENAPIVSSKEK